VFIHNDSNGVELPKVPSIGEVESWIRDQDASWRAEMVNVGVSILEAPGKSARPVEYKVRKVGDPSIKWFGEVTDVSFRHNGVIAHADWDS
jgi:ubiquitin-conjugating enzyme E2 O